MVNSGGIVLCSLNADQLFDNARDPHKIFHFVHRGRNKAGFVGPLLFLDIPTMSQHNIEGIQGWPSSHVESVVVPVEKKCHFPEKCPKLRLCARMSDSMVGLSFMRSLVAMHVGLKSPLKRRRRFSVDSFESWEISKILAAASWCSPCESGQTCGGSWDGRVGTAHR